MTALVTRASMVAAAAAAILALNACGDSSKDDSTTPAAGTVPQATATTEAPPATSTPQEGDGGFSDAGDTLALGTRVVAPYVVYGKGADKQTTKLGVTVVRVRKGRIGDFKDFKLDAKQKATVPYYVEMKYENLGDLKLQRFLLDPSIEDGDGEEYKPLNLIVLSGTFRKCPNPSRTRLQPGSSFTLCAPILLPKGKTFERVRFQGDVLQDPYFWK